MNAKTYAWMLDDTWTEYFDFFQEEEDYQNFSKQILTHAEQLISKNPGAHFVVRLSTEPELCLAELLLKLKKSYPDIWVELLTPEEELTTTWPDAVRERYFEVAGACDHEIILEPRATAKNIEKQYRHLLQHADQIILFTEEWCIHSSEVVFFLPPSNLRS